MATAHCFPDFCSLQIINIKNDQLPTASIRNCRVFSNRSIRSHEESFILPTVRGSLSSATSHTRNRWRQCKKILVMNNFYPKANRIVAISVLLLNVYFVFASIFILIEDGGTMGFGYMVLPITLLINLFIIPAAIALRPRFKTNVILFCVNFTGLCISSSLLLFILSIAYNSD